MRLSIATWNSQGSPLTNGEKAATLRALMTVCEVVLLQECGNLANSPAFNGRPLVSWEQAGAGNNRCSTAIVTTHYDATGVCGHTHTGRAGVWIRRGPLYVGTIHSTSNGQAADLSQMMKEMAKVAKIDDGNPLVIGGDFNFATNAQGLNVGTSSRPILFNVDTQARATQQRGNVLDYFVSANIHLKSIRKYQTKPSDHDGVTATYEF